MTNLEILIRNYIQFNNRPNAKGWLSVLCKVCNDHGKKGPRAAFIFANNSVSYHCFNCSHKASFSDSDEALTKNMVDVLKAFSIPDDEINQINFDLFKDNNEKGGNPQRVKRELKTDIKEIVMPSCCVPLSDVSDSNDWKLAANVYLKDIRCIDPKSYPFFIGFEQPNDIVSKKWDKRLIIPSYKDGKLVYFEGRDLTGTKAKKYLGAEVPKTNMLYGFDLLHKDLDKPLFVCEGFFDALLIGGVALFGNTLYKETIHHLTLSPRTKIIIPDRQGDGYKLAEHALNLGWKVSIPDTPNCKDVNDAILKYGKLYVVKSIMDNICEGFEAQMKINMYLK